MSNIICAGVFFLTLKAAFFVNFHEKYWWKESFVVGNSCRPINPSATNLRASWLHYTIMKRPSKREQCDASHVVGHVAVMTTCDSRVTAGCSPSSGLHQCMLVSLTEGCNVGLKVTFIFPRFGRRNWMEKRWLRRLISEKTRRSETHLTVQKRKEAILVSVCTIMYKRL